MQLIQQINVGQINLDGAATATMKLPTTEDILSLDNCSGSSPSRNWRAIFQDTYERVPKDEYRQCSLLALPFVQLVVCRSWV